MGGSGGGFFLQASRRKRLAILAMRAVSREAALRDTPLLHWRARVCNVRAEGAVSPNAWTRCCCLALCSTGDYERHGEVLVRNHLQPFARNNSGLPGFLLPAKQVDEGNEGLRVAMAIAHLRLLQPLSKRSVVQCAQEILLFRFNV